MKHPNWLLVAVAAMVFVCLTSEQRMYAGVLFVLLGVLYWLLWLVAVYPDRRRLKKEMRKRAIFHYEVYQQFQAKYQAIRDRYDPKGEWNEGTSIPVEYKEEMQALNLKYKETLDYRQSPAAYNDANGITSG